MPDFPPGFEPFGDMPQVPPSDEVLTHEAEAGHDDDCWGCRLRVLLEEALKASPPEAFGMAQSFLNCSRITGAKAVRELMNFYRNENPE